MLPVLLAALISSSAPHHEAPLRPGITFEEAMQRAEQAPAAEAALRAARDKRAAARGIHGLGNPEIALQAGGRRASSEDSGFDGSLSVVQPIPLAPIGRDRRLASAAEARLLDEQARRHVLEAKLRAAEAFCRLHAAEATLQEMKTRVELAEEMFSSLQRGREGGAFTSRDVAAGQAYLAEARLRLLEVEGEVFDLGIELAVAIGDPEPAAFRALGPLPQVDLPPEETWARALDPARLPSVLTGRWQEEAARARVQETETEGRALWLGIGGEVVREIEETAVLGTVALTLPLFQRSARERGTVLAEAREAEGDHRAAWLEARGRLLAWVNEVEHSALVLRHTEDDLLPAVEESARLTGLAYSANQVILLELFHAQDALAEVRSRAHRARAEHVFAKVRLALLLEAAQR